MKYLFKSPTPNFPYILFPNAYISPVWVNTKEWSSLKHDIFTNVFIPSINVGVDIYSFNPLPVIPHIPSILYPHEYALKSAMQITCFLPNEI